MTIKNKIIIAVCLVVFGAGIGAFSTYKIMKPEPLNNNNTTTTTGDTDKIKVKYITKYKDRIIIKTISTGSGTITTTIPKKEICPEAFRNNIISINLNPNFDNKVVFNYGLNYSHIFRNRIVLNTGINFNHNIANNGFSGFGVTAGIGIMF